MNGNFDIASFVITFGSIALMWACIYLSKRREMELNQTALNIMAIITIALCVYVGFLLIKQSKSDKQLQAK